MWALVDSNCWTEIPCRGFLEGSGGIIQAMSPNSDYYQGWAKEHKARFIIMDLWTQDEILALGYVVDLCSLIIVAHFLLQSNMWLCYSSPSSTFPKMGPIPKFSVSVDEFQSR
jgi:hypothetical protein